MRRADNDHDWFRSVLVQQIDESFAGRLNLINYDETTQRRERFSSDLFLRYFSWLCEKVKPSKIWLSPSPFTFLRSFCSVFSLFIHFSSYRRVKSVNCCVSIDKCSLFLLFFDLLSFNPRLFLRRSRHTSEPGRNRCILRHWCTGPLRKFKHFSKY